MFRVFFPFRSVYSVFFPRSLSSRSRCLSTSASPSSITPLARAPSTPSVLPPRSSSVSSSSSSSPSAVLSLHIPHSLARLTALGDRVLERRRELALLRSNGLAFDSEQKNLSRLESSVHTGLSDLLRSAVSQVDQLAAINSLFDPSSSLLSSLDTVSSVWDCLVKYSRPDRYSVSLAVAALARQGRYRKIDEIFEHCEKHNLTLDLVAFNTFLTAAVRSGRSDDDVHQIFKRMLHRGVQPNHASFTALLQGERSGRQLIDTLNSLRQHGLEIAPVTIGVSMLAFARLGAYDCCDVLWSHHLRHYPRVAAPIFNSRIRVLAMQNRVEDIQQMLKNRKQSKQEIGMEALTSALHGLFAGGHSEAAVRMHSNLEHGAFGGIQRSRTSYLTLLRLGWRSGLLSLSELARLYRCGVEEKILETKNMRKSGVIDLTRIDLDLIQLVMHAELERIYHQYREIGPSAIPRRGLLIILGRGLKEKVVQLQEMQIARAARMSGIDAQSIRAAHPLLEIAHSQQAEAEFQLPEEPVDQFPDPEDHAGRGRSSEQERHKQPKVTAYTAAQRAVLDWLAEQSPRLTPKFIQRPIKQVQNRGENERQQTESTESRQEQSRTIKQIQDESLDDRAAPAGRSFSGDDRQLQWGIDAQSNEGQFPLSVSGSIADPLVSHTAVLSHPQLLHWLQCQHNARDNGPMPKLRANQIKWFRENKTRIIKQKEANEQSRKEKQPQTASSSVADTASMASELITVLSQRVMQPIPLSSYGQELLTEDQIKEAERNIKRKQSTDGERASGSGSGKEQQSKGPTNGMKPSFIRKSNN